MLNETKELKIGQTDFTLVRLDPWRRLTFIADLQKDFFQPLINGSDKKDLTALLDNTKKEDFDIMSILSGFSSAIDSKSIEKWMKRVLNDGLVIYNREDGQRAKLSFSEINKFFTNPADIILLLKEAIVFNMVNINELVALFTNSNSQVQKVSEA